MAISGPRISGKVCFDMLKSKAYADLFRLFSSWGRSDRVYLGWYVWDLVKRGDLLKTHFIPFLLIYIGNNYEKFPQLSANSADS